MVHSEEDSGVVEGDFGGDPAVDSFESSYPGGQGAEAAAVAAQGAENSFDPYTQAVDLPGQLRIVTPHLDRGTTLGTGLAHSRLGPLVLLLRRQQTRALFTNLRVQLTPVIVPVCEHECALGDVLDEMFACDRGLALIERPNDKSPYSAVIIAKCVHLVPEAESSVASTGSGIGVLARLADRQSLAIDIRERNRLIDPGEQLMDSADDRFDAWLFESFTELADRGDGAGPHDSAVAVSSACPAQRPIVCDGPEKHFDNKFIAVVWPPSGSWYASSSRPDRDSDHLPNALVHTCLLVVLQDLEVSMACAEQ